MIYNDQGRIALILGRPRSLEVLCLIATKRFGCCSRGCCAGGGDSQEVNSYCFNGYVRWKEWIMVISVHI